jgi:hypothetical protein
MYLFKEFSNQVYVSIFYFPFRAARLAHTILFYSVATMTLGGSYNGQSPYVIIPVL